MQTTQTAFRLRKDKVSQKYNYAVEKQIVLSFKRRRMCMDTSISGNIKNTACKKVEKCLPLRATAF